MQTLVAYYSRTGNTKFLAEKILRENNIPILSLDEIKKSFK